jgi:hypothetical protein
MTKYLKSILLTAYLSVSAFSVNANLSAAENEQQGLQEAKEKWIFMFNSPQAEIIEAKSGTLQLIINDPNKTNIYMLNDRPFYLIRKIEQVGFSLWRGFSQSNYRPNQKIYATILIHNQPIDVFLSHYTFKNNIPTYAIESASTVVALKPMKGPMIMFVSTDSKPLCNVMNTLRHDSKSLISLQELNSSVHPG